MTIIINNFSILRAQGVVLTANQTSQRIKLLKEGVDGLLITNQGFNYIYIITGLDDIEASVDPTKISVPVPPQSQVTLRVGLSEPPATHFAFMTDQSNDAEFILHQGQGS